MYTLHTYLYWFVPVRSAVYTDCGGSLLINATMNILSFVRNLNEKKPPLLGDFNIVFVETCGKIWRSAVRSRYSILNITSHKVNIVSVLLHRFRYFRNCSRQLLGRTCLFCCALCKCLRPACHLSAPLLICSTRFWVPASSISTDIIPPSLTLSGKTRLEIFSIVSHRVQQRQNCF